MIRPRFASIRIVSVLLLLLAAAVVAAGCGETASDRDSDSGGDTSESADSGDVDAVPSSEVAARNDSYDAPPTKELDASKTYTVRMETSKGTFDIDVDPKAAPIAAANFVFLVEEGFYDGVPFHRVIEDFMIQGGDPTGTGTGGPGYQLKDDPVKGSYDRGTVAMANSGPDTGGSQFFIVHGTEVDPTLPKDYVIFGSVDEKGMEVVDEIAAVEVEPGPNGEPSSPVDPVLITKASLA